MQGQACWQQARVSKLNLSRLCLHPLTTTFMGISALLHSCGERCERPAQGCGHPCVLLCHPGKYNLLLRRVQC